MPGFLVGSVALIAAWALFQNSASGRVDQASNVAVALLRRVMSAEAAGLGNHANPSQKATLTDHTAGLNSSAGGRPPSYY